MEVKERVELLTAHIADPIEKARKQKNLLRALSVLESEDENQPQEPLLYDDGRFDGIPVAYIDEMDSKEDARLAALRAKRASIFELEGTEVEDEPVDPVNRRGKFGYTPLIQAVVDKDLNRIRELLKSGADVNIVDNGGMTAMDKARQEGDKVLIAALKSV